MSGTSISSALAAAAALACLGAPALAATAHNSQAGAYGPTSHTCAPTPYFATGGCFSAAIQDDRRYPFVVGATPDGPGRPFADPGRRLAYPDE